jgi:hypothetical protein
MEPAEDVAVSLKRFYRTYIEVFNGEEAGHFLDCFTRPYVTVSGERGLTIVPNDADREGQYRKMMDGLRRRGWVRSDIVRIEAWGLDPNLGMIQADVIRRKADESVLEEIRACYLVRREGEAWRIASITEVKPPFLGPGSIPR